MPNETKIVIKTPEAEQIDRINEKLDNIQRNRIALERQWYLNVAFLFGKQHFKMKKNGASLGERIWYTMEKIVDSKRERRVSNKILVYYRSLLSRMLKMKATINVEATTKAERDMNAAKVSDSVLKYIWENCNKNNPDLHKICGMQLVLKYLFSFILTFGKGYLKPYFNDNIKTAVLMDGNVAKEEFGEVEIDTPMPLFIYPDPLGRYIGERKILSTESVYNRFSTDVKAENVSLTDIEQQLLSLIDKVDYSKLEEAVTLKEYYHLPCRDYPKGRMFIYTDNQIILDDELPKEWSGKLPYFEFSWFDLMFSSIFQSFIEQLIPLQEEYNFTISKISEWKKFICGKLLVPDGANLQTKWTDETGQIVKHSRGLKPEYLPTPSPGQYLFADLKRIESDMQDIAMAHDVTLSQVPSGVKSGVAIERLQEKDDASLSPTTLEFETKLGFMADRLLDIVASRYTECRVLDTLDDEQKDDVASFIGSEVCGNRKIRVSLGSKLPHSLMARRQAILELIGAKIITPQEGKKFLDLGDVESAISDIDRKAARIENDNMEQGIPVEPQEWEQHAIHLETVRDRMARDDFRLLPAEIRTLFITHYEVHQDLLKKQVVGMQSLQGAQAPKVQLNNQ